MKNIMLMLVKKISYRQKYLRSFFKHLGLHLWRFWVERFPIDNTWLQKDVAEAFKNLIFQTSLAGRLFGDEYHRKDGIGDYKQRKRMVNTLGWVRRQ